jgi:hypothetical protein
MQSSGEFRREDANSHPLRCFKIESRHFRSSSRTSERQRATIRDP